MRKVPPPSAGSPRPTASSGADRARRPRAPAAPPKLAKAQKAFEASAEETAESAETAATGEVGAPSREETAKALEEKAHAWAPDDKADRDERLSRDEEVEKEERAEAPATTVPRGGTKEGRPAEKTPKKGKPSDGFERTEAMREAAQQPMRAAAALVAKAVAAAPPPPSPRPGKAPDAMSLLNAAQQAGVFFEEDSRRDGHSEEKDDPELGAAVEEAIRLLFGVAGVHRVGPGRNETGEPVVVVVAGRGFGEASLKRVPERVHRFATLLALPYELLPLRRER